MNIDVLLPALFKEQMPDGSDMSIQGLGQCVPIVMKDEPNDTCYEQQLMRILGIEIEDPAHLPLADCLYLDTPAQHHVCAQPVHFDASHDNASLLPGQCLQITQEEADALVASLNELWNPDAINVFASSTTDWQLSGQDAAALDCLPVSMLAFKSVAEAMPRSEKAASWRQLLTEAQMLLHDHPVNLSRQERGLRTINGLWFFGGASLDRPTQTISSTLYSVDRFTQGLANKCGISCNDLSVSQLIKELKEQADSQQHTVIVDTRLQQAWLANDKDQFEKIGQALVQQLLQPLAELQAQLKQFDYVVDDCGGNQFRPQKTTGLKAKIKAAFSAWR